MTNSFWINSRPVAHRGLFDNKQVPENSGASIKRAMDANFAVELDVSVSGDGKAIVFHDDTLSRMTKHDGYVGLTSLEEIQKTSLIGEGGKVLTLKQALSLIDGKVPVILEIMPSSTPNFETSIVEGVMGYKGDFAVCSANPFILEWFKLNAPHIKRGQRVSAFKKEKPDFAKKSQLKKMKFNNLSEPNFIAVKASDLKKCKIKKILKSGVPVVLYSVDDKKKLRKAKELGLNFVFEGNFENIEEI